MKLVRPFTARYRRRAAVAGETLALPLLAVGAGIQLNPADPLWINGPFPWAWLAPTILALRHGSLAGLASAAVLLLSWVALSFLGTVSGGLPKLNFLGGLILVMLTSEFSSRWAARARRAEGARTYLEEKLEYLTHQHYVLRLSHDCLEQDLISRPMALRDALAALRDLAARNDSSALLPGADALLKLLAEYCQLEAAALYTWSRSGGEALLAAELGAESIEFNAFDPLVRLAHDKGTLAHVAQSLAAGKNPPSRYLVAAPLKTFDGRVLGLLLVERMPFFALQEEMLQSLNLLLRYYSDGLATLALTASLCKRLPDCPPEFALELQRLWHVEQEFGIASVIVALEFPAPGDGDEPAAEFGRHKRSIDITWLVDDGERKVLLTLMPLAGIAAAEGYLAGIESSLRQKRDRSLEELGIFAQILPVGAKRPFALLETLLDNCHVRVDAGSLLTGT